jgi:hypothetical protein
MPRTLSQMLAAANTTTRCDPGSCLHTCAEWWLGRASGEPYAYTDWLNAKQKLAASATPEVGMLAHWHHTAAASARHKLKSGYPGHIAVVVKVDAAGHVWVRSTDMNDAGQYAPGHVGTCRLEAVTKAMGLVFDGYARDIAGVEVVPVPKTDPVAAEKAALKAAKKQATVDRKKARAKGQGTRVKRLGVIKDHLKAALKLAAKIGGKK